MTEFLGGIFASIFGTHSILATILISMFPIIELKGAIPIGMSIDYWGEYALNGTEAFLYSLLGSCLVVPIIALVFTPIVNWLKRTKAFKKLGTFIDEKVRKHSTDVMEKTEKKQSKNKTLIKCILIFAFVAVPLPLTGVWTGTCVAVAIGLKFYQTVISVVLGNVVAGLIIVFVCSIFPEITTILSIIFLVVVVAIVIFGVIKFIISNRKQPTENVESSDNNQQ